MASRRPWSLGEQKLFPRSLKVGTGQGKQRNTNGVLVFRILQPPQPERVFVEVLPRKDLRFPPRAFSPTVGAAPVPFPAQLHFPSQECAADAGLYLAAAEVQSVLAVQIAGGRAGTGLRGRCEKGGGGRHEPRQRGGISVCILKARPASGPPAGKTGMAFAGLMRRPLGSWAPSAAFGGDGGSGEDNSWNWGHWVRTRLWGARARFSLPAPAQPPSQQEKKASGSQRLQDLC